MVVTLFRTAILYIIVIISLRIMGKRQIGDMQPNELVITILISEIASIPIQDINQPVVNGVIAIFLLVILEVLLSILTMKNGKARSFIDGRPAIIINDGKINQKAMKSMRLTVDDLFEGLRQQGVFNIEDVSYAIIETNGKLSVMLKVGERPATASQMNVSVSDNGLAVPVICDGRIQSEFMQVVGLKMTQVDQILKSRRLTADEVFIMTLDQAGNAIVFKRKEDL